MGAKAQYRFNPRTRVGCDDVSSDDRDRMMFQSTHPCGVRRDKLASTTYSYVVSIHAPVWGATFGSMACNSKKACFNPRTRVGCDQAKTHKYDEDHSFNPRTRVGCDCRCGRTGYRKQVSIHAPVWGATARLDRFLSFDCFNPRTRVGCDASANARRKLSEFQSTHPCGVRP